MNGQRDVDQHKEGIITSSSFDSFNGFNGFVRADTASKLAEEPEDSRYEITEAIESLKRIYRQNSSALLLKIFFDAKTDEIVNIYSDAFPNEQARIIKTLVEVDPSNSTKYQSISEEEKKGGK